MADAPKAKPRLAPKIAAKLGRLWRRLATTPSLAYLHDVVVAVAAFAFAAYLRLGADPGLQAIPAVLQSLFAISAISIVVFAAIGPYRSLWVYVSLREILAIARMVTATIGIFAALRLVLDGLQALPPEVLVIAWFIMGAGLAAPRVLYRITAARRSLSDRRGDDGEEMRIRLLLVGAGDATDIYLRALSRERNPRYRVVGIVDEMGTFVRRRIHGVDVLGSLEDIADVVAALDAGGDRPERLVVTEDNLSPVAMRALLDEAESLGLMLNRIPRPTDLTHDLEGRIDVRPVAIEDLLGRPQTHLDRESMARLCRGARILVTGAGGSIGSELVRQVSAFDPARVVLLDNSEFALYQIDLELTERHPTLDRHPVMADIRDRERIREVFRAERPDLVFHAGALKHVPVVEMHPCEGVLTNVLGTRNIADCCREFGAKAMVLISTDKAVNPTNVMGATKRIAESYCQALDIEGAKAGGRRTRFVTVRFGNVLGSTGSVVPLFQRQLANGGPLTVTHPHVTRYFMTVHEAVELVLQSSAVGIEGSAGNGRIFVLDMGEPVRIQDLARQMIRLAGLRPGYDIDIVYTGLRPGEKLFEEVLHAAEVLTPTEVRGIFLAAPRTADFEPLSRAIGDLIEAARVKDSVGTLAMIETLVPEYQRPAPDEEPAPARQPEPAREPLRDKILPVAAAGFGRPIRPARA